MRYASDENFIDLGAAKTTPITELRIAKLKAIIWQRDSREEGISYTVGFQRNDRDVRRFPPADLLILAKLADKAHSFISDLEP